jgi:hypothetical protein
LARATRRRQPDGPAAAGVDRSLERFDAAQRCSVGNGAHGRQAVKLVNALSLSLQALRYDLADGLLRGFSEALIEHAETQLAGGKNLALVGLELAGRPIRQTRSRGSIEKSASIRIL